MVSCLSVKEKLTVSPKTSEGIVWGLLLMVVDAMLDFVVRFVVRGDANAGTISDKVNNIQSFRMRMKDKEFTYHL